MKRSAIVALVVSAVMGLVACGSSSIESSDSSVVDATSTTLTTVPPTASEPSTTASPPPVDSTVDSSDTEFPMIRGSRYCELLFLKATPEGLQATVYGTQGISYCPAEHWEPIDAAALATETESLFVMKNGPRGWLVDHVRKDDIDESARQSFGELQMNRLAVVNISDPTTVGKPYTWQEVDRRSVFTFEEGSTEYFLTDSEGHRYVMQAFSQQVDPTMSEDSLPTLGDRLALPEGWTYTSEVLTEDLVVETMTTKARVLQDELLNSYCWVPGT